MDVLIECHMLSQSNVYIYSIQTFSLPIKIESNLPIEILKEYGVKSIDFIDTQFVEPNKIGRNITTDNNGIAGEYKYPLKTDKKYDLIFTINCPIYFRLRYYIGLSIDKTTDYTTYGSDDLFKFCLNLLKKNGKLVIYYEKIDDKDKDKALKKLKLLFPFKRGVDIEIHNYPYPEAILPFLINKNTTSINSIIILTRTTDMEIIKTDMESNNRTSVGSNVGAAAASQNGGKQCSNKKTLINHKHSKIHKIGKTRKNILMSGGGGNAPMDLQGLKPEDVQALMQQGIMPEQIAQLAQEQGQPVPPVILEILSQSPGGMAPGGMAPGGMETGMAPPPADKTKKFPAMMDLPTYAQYKNIEKKEEKRKLKFGAHKPTVFGYVFSDLISEEILRDMKRTQGGFLIGVNLNNLFNTFREAIKMDEKDKSAGKMKNSEEIFKRVGEYVNVDFDKILETKMGYRGSDVPMLPEQALNEYASFDEILDESKKYADSAFKGVITPIGLLIMTRMLYKYRKNNAQWVRVATVLELIHRYLGGNKSRVEFFKEREEIPIQSLIDLEEFYNTDHIFMTEDEINKFKKDLDFYKYDPNINIRKQIQELLSKAPPII